MFLTNKHTMDQCTEQPSDEDTQRTLTLSVIWYWRTFDFALYFDWFRSLRTCLIFDSFTSFSSDQICLSWPCHVTMTFDWFTLTLAVPKVNNIVFGTWNCMHVYQGWVRIGAYIFELCCSVWWSFDFALWSCYLTDCSQNQSTSSFLDLWPWPLILLKIRLLRPWLTVRPHTKFGENWSTLKRLTQLIASVMGCQAKIATIFQPRARGELNWCKSSTREEVFRWARTRSLWEISADTAHSTHSAAPTYLDPEHTCDIPCIRGQYPPSGGPYQWDTAALDEFPISATTRKQKEPWLMTGAGGVTAASQKTRISQRCELPAPNLTFETS